MILKRLACLLLGHRFLVVQEFDSSQRRVGCWRCRREWAMHDAIFAFILWDEELAELYRSAGFYLLKW
jgi:hypothetical protein